MARRVVVCLCESGIIKIVKSVIESVCDELSIARVFVDSVEEVKSNIERTLAYCLLYVGEEQENLLEKLRGVKNGFPCRVVVIKNSSKFLDSNAPGDREILFPINESELSVLDLYQIVGKHLRSN